MAFPYEIPDDSAVFIMRYHDEKAERLTRLSAKPSGDYKDGTFYVDKEGGYIYIYASGFSTYALGLVPEEKEEKKEEKKQAAAPTPAPDYSKLMVMKQNKDVTSLFKKYGETGYKYKFKSSDKKIISVKKKGQKQSKTGQGWKRSLQSTSLDLGR